MPGPSSILVWCMVAAVATLVLGFVPTTVAIKCYSCDSRNASTPCYGNLEKVECVEDQYCETRVRYCFGPGTGTWSHSSGCRPSIGRDLQCLGKDYSPDFHCCSSDLCNFQFQGVNPNYSRISLSNCRTNTNPSTTNASTTAAVPTASTVGGSDTSTGSNQERTVVIVTVLLVCFAVLAAILVLGLVYRRRCRGQLPLVNIKSPRIFTTATLQSETGSCDSSMVMGESSGRGVLQLEERTISREIELRELIGTGRFGEVYRGVWRGNQVAVKIFKTIEEASFFREVDLFNTYMLRHENILGFQAADNRDFNMETQLWMVLDYHCNGSLYDYLRHHTAHNSSNVWKWLTREDLHKLALSLASGLMHLHNHIDGQSFGHKPSIAHRDLKSKNILVKRDGTCCIADLGMAIRNQPTADSIEFLDKDNLKVGTRRYMAPEILDDSINACFFESFRKVDMYALALVFWEITHVCCPPAGVQPVYKFPFEASVPGDPSTDDMYTVVCVKKVRPTLPAHWLEDENLKPIVRIIRTCWKESPQARFAANRVWKNIQELNAESATFSVAI